MNFVWMMVLCGTMALIGEYFCKLATQTTGTLQHIYTVIPALLWGSSAWIWVHMYRMKSMAQVIAIYSPTLLIATATMAIFLFGETLTWRLVVAYILVMVIIYLVG